MLNEIKSFMQDVDKGLIEIYNEFSLQHELGIYLRNALPNQRVQFERNISFFGANPRLSSFCKKEIDISLFTAVRNCVQSKDSAIELKLPQNGQYPEQMYSFIKDISFMEQVKNNLGFSSSYCLTVVQDKLFFSGDKTNGIYSFFRTGNTINGRIFKPTGNQANIDSITISGLYNIKWIHLKNYSYYVLSI